MITLQSPRLTLRPIVKTDLAELFKLQSYPKVAQYNTIGIPENEGITKTYLETAIDNIDNYFKTNFWWAIINKETSEFIGEAGLTLSIMKYQSGEIFYGLSPQFWRKGYAIEAVRAILNYGFVDLNLHRITAGVATKNIRSIHLLEKIGMKREGKHQKILPIRGEWWDNYLYALLEEDFFREV